MVILYKYVLFIYLFIYFYLFIFTYLYLHSGIKWSKETPASPSISSNSSEDETKVTMTLPRFPGNAEYVKDFEITTLARNYQ